MSVVKITEENFEALVMQATGPVLLDFWATWCGPCKMIAPVVEEVAAERADILVGKIDVDETRSLALRFGITSIPTLIVMENGQKKGQLVGFRPKEDIVKLLDA